MEPHFVITPTIQKFFLLLTEEKRQAAMALREVILSAEPKLTEAIKWGNLTFVSGKANIAFIYTYPQTDYINLGFMQAVNLTDPRKLFEGTGKGMRHIKIRMPKDIPVAQVGKWVKEAVLLSAGS